MIYVTSSRVGKWSLQRFLSDYFGLEKTNGELQIFRDNYKNNNYSESDYKELIERLSDFEIINDLPFFDCEFDRDLLLKMIQKNYKFIILYRKNILDTYLSGLISEKLSEREENPLNWGTFTKEKKELIKNKLGKFEVDFTKFKNFVENEWIDKKIKDIEDTLNEKNVRFYKIDYESIYSVVNRKQNIKELVNYLQKEQINEDLIEKHINDGELKFINPIDKKEIYKYLIINFEQIENFYTDFENQKRLKSNIEK